MFGRFQKLLLATTALVPLGLAPAVANPLGSQVVGGSATVQGQGTATVTVTQQTNSAIINWNTFNIGAGEKTNIVMPSSSSVQLDRVTGGFGPSQIFGSLWSNGRVFLVNPDGILIGPGAKIDTASFLATTHDIANADFMAGRYNFSISGRSDASVVNQGLITAQNGGFAALVAPGVRNAGTITANLGTVALASGNGFTLDFYGDRLITLGLSDSIAAQVKDVATGQTLSSLVSNEGKLKANGGTVQLTAVAARTVVDSVINNRGVIEANSIGTHNGMIVLGAATGKSKPTDAPTQLVKVSGKLSAAGKRKGQTGGTVEVTGEVITLANATIDASGRAGGGTVLIGGDVGGGNPNPAVSTNSKAALQPYAVPTATTVSVDGTSTINASSKDVGDGGKVVVWADGSTTFNGSISARGGTQSGDGGFVETSGHSLDFVGARVDTSVSYGRTGLWLLDPYDLTIDSSSAATIGANLATANVTVQTNITSSSGPGLANSNGNGDIFVNSGISWNSANTLTLSAYRNVNVNAGISSAGGASVTLRADNTGTGIGTVIFGGGQAGTIYTSGIVSIYYNPDNNPAGSTVNSTSYAGIDTDYQLYILESLRLGAGQVTPYRLVNSIYDLQNIQNNLSANYALGKDIDASATIGWNGGAGFVPLGNLNICCGFSGVFDGQNRTIDRLTINSGEVWVGLFGVIESSGMISNLGLTNLSVTGAAGSQRVGGLAGENHGTIRSVSVQGTVTNGPPFILQEPDGPIANPGYVGGLVGDNFGQISGSSANVFVDGRQASQAGGLVGLDDAQNQIFNSNTVGQVIGGDNSNVGGIAGSGAEITGSYSSVTVIGGDNSFVGGLQGNGGAVTSSYSTGNVSGGAGSSVGGVSGGGFKIIQSYATGSVTGGLNSNVGGLVGVIASGPGPNIISVAASYATGSVSGGDGSNVGGLVGKSSALNSFICGNFGGCFHLISSGSIDQSFALGSATGGANSNVGGLVGLNDSAATTFFGSISYAVSAISNSFASGPITGGTNSTVGGLVGWNKGSVTQSYSTGQVTGATGAVLGGFTGKDDSQSYNSTFSNNYWDIQTSGQTTDGASSGSIGLQTAGLKTVLPSGFDSTVWALSASLNSGYPYLIGNVPPALTPPTPTPVTTQPTLPSDVTDIFGNGQTTSFITKSSTQTAGLGQGVTSQSSSISVSTILNSAGFNYLTAPALGELLDRLLLNIPLQYLSQSESDTLSNQISNLLQNEMKDAPLAGGVVGLELTSYVGGLVVDLIANYVHDSMVGKYPAVLVELYKYEIEVAGNSAIATVMSGGDLPLGVAQGVIQASTAEVIDTAKTWYLWHDDSTAMLVQADKLQLLVNNTHAAAENAKSNGDNLAYEQLMKVAIGLQGAVGTLRESALSPVSDQGTTLNAIWQSLWNK